MKLAGSCILVTGAGGGIGRCVSLELARRGARLALAGRDMPRLQSLADGIRASGGTAICCKVDLARAAGHADLIKLVAQTLGGLDALVNNAGVSRFAAFAGDTPHAIRELIDVNVTGTLLLTQAALPHFLSQNAGSVVIVGSILGSIGFPHFAAYSASKFALRGFAEALRRELLDTGVRVSYVAPRATDTGMNPSPVRELFAETGSAMDTPAAAAAHIVAALETDGRETYIGWPERFFVRLNGLLPRVVDFALRGQNRVAERIARQTGR